jgi:AbrB family looped-hinge helix DNA binding protein
MEATLTSRGQLTVPKPIRDRLRLHAGDRLQFVLRDDGHVEMVPKRSSLRELKGLIKPPVTGVTLAGVRRAIAAGACADGRR